MDSAYSKVIIVDDEAPICTLLARTLSLAGYQTFTSTSPKEALKIIEENHIKIVVSDLIMPEMNGVELLRQVKKIDGLTQFIMISGYADITLIVDSFRLGANNILFKPFESNDLITEEVHHAREKLEKIKQILHDRKALRSS